MPDHSAETPAHPGQPAAAAQVRSSVLPVTTDDGSAFELLCVEPVNEWRQWLYWLPALGVSARHYLPLAEALAARGIAMVVHEWRGLGSSNLRASRSNDWAYRDLLMSDLPAALATVRRHWSQPACWLGGHSLGGQLAAIYASLHSSEHAGLVLVASGSPYWRQYRHGRALAAAYVATSLLTRALGYLPGRRIGFGGNEARGLIIDWARTGCTGRYAAAGVAQDLESELAKLSLPVLALRLRDDWMAPPASLNWLLDKMPLAPRTVAEITPSDLDGRPAGHFNWMKTPDPIAHRLADWIGAQDSGDA